MSQEKKSIIKSIIAIVEVDGVDCEVAISDLHRYASAFSLEKVYQPANPMAPGTQDMFGIKLTVTTDHQFSLEPTEVE